MQLIHEITPYKKNMQQVQFSDKLYMFNEVEKATEDQNVYKQFNQIIKRRREMFKAMEKLEKQNRMY